MFELTITTPHKETTFEFETREEAKAKIKEFSSDLGLTRQRGFWANAKTGTELTTNF